MKDDAPTLGLKTALSMVIGTVIGSGIFLTSSNVVAAVPYSFWPLTAWFAAGVISMMGCLIFSELGTKFPKSGGQYIYLFESFGPLLAYLYGWTLIAVIQSGAIAAEASIFAQFTNAALGANAVEPKLLAGAAIVGFTALNILGLKKATDVLDCLTFIKMIALVMIPVSILFFFKLPIAAMASGANGTAAGFQNHGAITLSGFGVALIAAFWAFDGWNSLGYIAGDVKNARKNIPLATIGGMGFVIILYLCVNWAYQKVLSPSEIAASANLATDVLTRAFGKTGGFAVSLAVIITTLGTTNAFVIAGSRIILAMAKKGGLPLALSKTSATTRVPVNAFVVQMIWSLVLLYSGRFDELFTSVIMVSFIFYGLTALGLIVLRRRDSRSVQGEFEVALWVPVLYTVFCLAFTINSVIEKPKESVAGLVLVALGVPAFYLFKALNVKANNIKTVSRGAPAEFAKEEEHAL